MYKSNSDWIIDVDHDDQKLDSTAGGALHYEMGELHKNKKINKQKVGQKQGLSQKHSSKPVCCMLLLLRGVSTQKL